MTNTENASLCTPCGGKCCKNLPGGCTPFDFKDLSYNGIRALIEGGTYQVDYIKENDCIVYFIRPRTIPDKDKYLAASFYGQCVLLTDKGCQLSYAERPTQCKTLIPLKLGCQQKMEKIELAKTWRDFQNVIKQVLTDLGAPLEISDLEMLFNYMDFRMKFLGD